MKKSQVDEITDNDIRKFKQKKVEQFKKRRCGMIVDETTLHQGRNAQTLHTKLKTELH